MSVAATSYLSQGISMLLARMSGTQSVMSGMFSDGDGDADSSPSIAPSTGAANNVLTGSTKASVSDQVLALLTQLQQLAGDLSGASSASSSTAIVPLTAASSTTIAPSSTMIDPLAKLISAMDTNGDGTVSQSEMESYIENLGGTASQADALFAGLSQGNTGNLTQTQLASDLQQGQQALQANSPFGHRHHHHHGVPSAEALANHMMTAVDSNGDGAISQSEFENFVTGLGGTTSEADSDFAALDPNKTGSVTAAQITAAIKAFEAAGSNATIATNSASPILTLLDSLKANASSSTASSTTGSTANVTA